MGAGIAAAIPMVLRPSRHGWGKTIERGNFSDQFFDNYTVDESGDIYTIKPEVLVENYQSFLAESRNCIGEEYEADKVPSAGTYDEFVRVFDFHTHNVGYPFVCERRSTFSFLGGESYKYWHFYSGSYKAFLETYCTLTHLERLLAKAMRNPLAHCVKFGIFG